jgi:hypothetical protein
MIVTYEKPKTTLAEKKVPKSNFRNLIIRR